MWFLMEIPTIKMPLMRASPIANSFYGLWFRWRWVRYNRGGCLSVHSMPARRATGRAKFPCCTPHSFLTNPQLHFDIARCACGSKSCAYISPRVDAVIIPQLSPPVPVAPTRCVPRVRLHMPHGLLLRLHSHCSNPCPVVAPPLPFQRSHLNPLRPALRSLLSLSQSCILPR